ncbi:MAG: S-layer homology domain-containing protein [Propionibacteriaceae bacterium]|nr:S-layer homology domain-containing protein [Propionibacteriaceae bacterium]
MSTTLQRSAIGLVAATALLISGSPAVAAAPQASPLAPNRAAHWLTTQQGEDGSYQASGMDATVDATLALTAATTPALQESIDAGVAHIKKSVTQPIKVTDAAKLAVLADALGSDAQKLFGVDAAATMTEAVNRDGSIDGSTGAFADAWVFLGIERSGNSVNDITCNHLALQQDATTGAFGYEWPEGTFNPDLDTTGMALMALASCESALAKTATTKASAWLAAQQKDDGSFPNDYSPVNTTALAMMGLDAAGADTGKAGAWLAAQQGTDGGLVYDGESNLLATVQALPALAGKSYLDTEWKPGATFTDVTTTTMFFDEIEWAAARGITTGWDDGTYRPLDQINRDAMAAFLYRLAGSPEVTLPKASPFTDLKPTDLYYKEIVWLAQQKITTGYDDGTFRPLDKVGRDATAAFLFRYAKVIDHTPAKTSPFIDLLPSDMFYKEIAWAAEKGIVKGWPDKSFKPVTPVARDAMAAFLHRVGEMDS